MKKDFIDNDLRTTDGVVVRAAVGTNENGNVVHLCDRIVAEIETLIKKADPATLTAYEVAVASLEKIREIRALFSSQLEENLAHLETERSKAGLKIDIVESMQKRRNIEREIAESELSMKEVDTEFWPAAQKAVNDTREKIINPLVAIIFEMKRDYQAQLDALFLESISIMEAFQDAVYHISQKPEFCKIGGSLAATLTSFDLTMPMFNQMTKLNMGFGIISPKEIGNNPYQVVVCRKEQ